MRILSLNLKLAKLGDAYVNFLVSAALTLHEGKPVGTKVSGKILAVTYARSQLAEKCVKVRGVEKAEVVEALLGYAWLGGILDAERGVRRLAELLKRGYTLEDGLVELVNSVVSGFDEVKVEV